MPARPCASEAMEDAASPAASFALAEGVDRASLASRFREQSRIRIAPLLAGGGAERLHAHLDSRDDWALAYNDGAEVRTIASGEIAGLSAEQRRAILAGIDRRARAGFQFVYNLVPLLADYFDRSLADTPAFEAFEFLNSARFLAAMRRVTGDQNIRWADAQATRFRAGQFLSCHGDEAPADNRIAAYVLNLTPVWQRDWGGYLQFFDTAGDVEAAFRPIFNSLCLFAVPAPHSVQQVATYCAASRYAITGWLRGDTPPADLGWRAELRGCAT